MHKEDIIKARQLSVIKLKNELVNLVLVTLGIISIPMLLASLVRAKDVGFLPIMYVHSTIVLILVGAAYFRQKLSFKMRSGIIIGALLMVGVVGLWKFGLTGNAIPFLLAGVILTTILFGRKAGFITSAFSLCVLLVYFVLVLTGRLVFDVDFNDYNLAGAAWITFILSFCFLAIIFVVLLGRFNQFFFELVNNLEKHVTESTKELKKANQAKSEFLANMSHEIRTPMNGVLGMLRLLIKTELNDEQKHKVILAKSSAESLLSLINDILDFSKVEAGKLETDIIEFNLRAMLDELCEANALKVQNKGVELILDLSGVTTSLIKGDPGKIRQILTNLIGNAVKFTDKGEILVSARLYKDNEIFHLACEVKDTGIGIPENKLSTLFDLFTQVDASTTREYGGTGLGLSICLKLCEFMEGELKVTSQYGKGSTFEFDIPVQQSKLAKPVKPDFSVNNLNILLVDDNQCCRSVLANQLRVWGVNVITASSTDEALRICNHHITENTLPPFDGIITDYYLSRYKGLSLEQHLSQKKELREIISITLVDLNHDTKEGSSEQTLTNNSITKPATTADLFYALSKIAKRLDLTANEGSRYSASPLFETEIANDLNSIKLQELRSINASVLMVEDNFVNQQVVQGILEEFNITVEIAENGQDALRRLAESKFPHAFDLVLMDCQMPELDGYESSRQIRQGHTGEYNQTIPIIAMTANALSGDKEKCIAAGMNDYLSKPIEPNWLLTKLHHWLVTSESTSEPQLDIPKQRQQTSQTSANKNNVVGVWDKAAVLKRVLNKEKLLNKLVRSFLSAYEKNIHQLYNAIKSNNNEQIDFYAHTLKGIASNIGGLRLTSEAVNLQILVKENKTDQYQNSYIKIKQNGTELTEKLVEYLSSE